MTGGCLLSDETLNRLAGTHRAEVKCSGPEGNILCAVQSVDDPGAERSVRPRPRRNCVPHSQDYGPVCNENVIPRSNSYVFGGCRSMQGPITEMQPNSSVQERSSEQKILDLTNKIIQMLTGEVPIRCQDISVYFSMEEWEYIEGHKDQYKDMITPQDLTRATYELGEFYPPFSSPLYLKNDHGFHTVVQEVRCPSMGELNLISYQDNFAKNASSSEGICLRQEIRPYTWHIKQDTPNNFGRLCNEGDNGQQKSIYNHPIFLDHTYAIPAQKTKKRVFTDADIPTPKNTQEYLTSQPAFYNEGRDTYTGLHTPLDSIQYNTVHIKEESMSHEGNPIVTDYMQEYKRSYTMEEPVSGNITDTGFSTSTELAHGQFHIKEEPVSYNVSNLKDTDFSTSTELAQGQFYIKKEPKEEPVSYIGGYTENTALNTPTFHTPHHTAHHFQEDQPSEIDIYLPTDTDQTISSKHVHRRLVCQKRNTDKPFFCTECGKSFLSKSGLSTHKKIHMLRKPYTCTECNKTFLIKPNLVRHQMIHCGEKYSCERSGKCFSKASNLNVHQKIQTLKGPFSCAKCGKRFLSNSNFIRHQKFHGLEKPFACTECDKWFSSKGQLVEHCRLHSGEKTFSCPDCGKTFIKVQNLLKHQRLHTGKNPFSCIECGKNFTSNNYLIRHMQLHTSKTTSYPCAICGKYFDTSLDLTIHQRIHAEGKPGTNSEWRKCFIRKLGFVIHQRNHAKDKPYSCTECKARFMKKSNLFLHQKVHSGVKSEHIG
ncbi:uncharacterized protein [Dendrobates tinctorius]|uniref:uncharacterized protein isoform X2 n=1 Tax=Dendrobates tinctorius TaxID=92724 RepID=UPI003CCA3310